MTLEIDKETKAIFLLEEFNYHASHWFDRKIAEMLVLFDYGQSGGIPLFMAELAA